MENPIRKIWYDENSMPPKNLVWFKGGKYYEYKNGKWIESTEFGKTSSSNTHVYKEIDGYTEADLNVGDILLKPIYTEDEKTDIDAGFFLEYNNQENIILEVGIKNWNYGDRQPEGNYNVGSSMGSSYFDAPVIQINDLSGNFGGDLSDMGNAVEIYDVQGNYLTGKFWGADFSCSVKLSELQIPDSYLSDGLRFSWGGDSFTDNLYIKLKYPSDKSEYYLKTENGLVKIGTDEGQMSTELGQIPNQEFVAYLVDLLQNHLISSDNGNMTFSAPIPYGTLVNVNNAMSGENQSACAYFVPIRYQGGKLDVYGYKKVTNERYSYDGTNTIESYTVLNIDSGFSFTIQSDYTVKTFSPI